ncbi:MAG: lipopolysaccharide assembly protein LapB [Rhodoferax sp.]|nr:lipopolysaccharide assembly protein LapB [Rhodoferax sp.]
MGFELSWLLIGLPAAFALGWLASRLDLRQLRLDNRLAPKAYFRGLNFLLNEQQDQAIDAFIEAVQNDPDTTELHFALGNLFRRRGEYQRAVRVHEHLLSRGDLSRADRHRAQHALALDYLKAGLLDRAQEALQKLEGTPFEAQARLELLAVHERSRDWAQAASVALRLDQAQQGSFESRRAHYLCEQAAERLASGDSSTCESLLRQALQIAPQSARPRMELARLARQQGHPELAFEELQACALACPAARPLLAAPLVEVAQACGRQQVLQEQLQTWYAQSPSIDLLEGLVQLRRADAPGRARQTYLEHLEREPSLVAATRWLAHPAADEVPAPTAVQRALEQATRPLSRYRCAACGFEARQHFW